MTDGGNTEKPRQSLVQEEDHKPNHQNTYILGVHEGKQASIGD